MAKETKEKTAPAVEEQQDTTGVREGNLLASNENILKDALAEIEKEKDEKKKRTAKRAICVAVYYNLKTRIQLRKRRKEADLNKEKLTKSMELVSRLLGVKVEIGKDGRLIPTKEKIAKENLLTPAELDREKNKLNEEMNKKFKEIDQKEREEIQELRNSYEGDYCWYNDWD